MDVEKVIRKLNRNNLLLDENETVLRMQGDDRSIWYVWSNDPVMIRRIAKKGNKIVGFDEYGVSFNLDSSQVRFFTPITEEQREELRKRGEELKENLING